LKKQLQKMNTFSSYTNPLGQNSMNDNFPDIKIEFMNDGKGDGLILLSQFTGEDDCSVSIHPIHLRYMAEKFGLIETSDPLAQKTIATLTRRLHLLRDRIDHLHNYLVNHSDHKHADLSYEVTYATACIDLADEFCYELVDAELQEVTPATSPATATPPVQGSPTLPASVTPHTERQPVGPQPRLI